MDPAYYQSHYFSDPQYREMMRQERELARRSYTHAKETLERLNAQYRFEEPESDHVPSRYRDFLLREVNRIVAQLPDATTVENTKVWRRVMDAIMYGDKSLRHYQPYSSSSSSNFFDDQLKKKMESEQALKLQMMMSQTYPVPVLDPKSLVKINGVS